MARIVSHSYDRTKSSRAVTTMDVEETYLLHGFDDEEVVGWGCIRVEDRRYLPTHPLIGIMLQGVHL